MADVKTIQSGIKQYDNDKNKILSYSLFLGGLNATHQSLAQYDPLKTGYNRIFFVKMPLFMEKIMPDATKRIRHLMEYGFTEISGINGTTLDMDQITGGYAGKQFDVPTVAKDETNSISITTYEFAGSPIREYMDMWISGISDPYTGLSTYHGVLDENSSVYDSSIKYSQSSHVAEAIYVATDPTGLSSGIEYACLLTNMMPKQVKKDQFNYSSGTHGLVTMETEFTCVKYESEQINKIAKALVGKFQTMRDYLDFTTEYTTDDNDGVQAGRIKYKMANWPSDAKYNDGVSPT